MRVSSSIFDFNTLRFKITLELPDLAPENGSAIP
jgi:hypothetical protein